MPDPLQDYQISYIKPCQGLLLFTPFRAPQNNCCPQVPSQQSFCGGKKKKKSNTILMSGDIGGLSTLKLWFLYEALHLRGTRESFFGHLPNSKSYKAQPHPSTHLQTSPPAATSLLKSGDTFLPTYLSYSPLRSWSPIFERSKFWGASLTFGVQEKRDAPVASLASFLSAGSRTGECPGEGDPHKRALEGFLHSQSELGTPPPKPVPAHPSPTRRERQLQCPSQIPPTLHSSPHLEGSRGPQKIPKKSRMLGRRS